MGNSLAVQIVVTYDGRATFSAPIIVKIKGHIFVGRIMDKFSGEGVFSKEVAGGLIEILVWRLRAGNLNSMRLSRRNESATKYRK